MCGQGDTRGVYWHGLSAPLLHAVFVERHRPDGKIYCLDMGSTATSEVSSVLTHVHRRTVKVIASACTFLASKVEERYKKLRDVVKEVLNLSAKDPKKAAPSPEVSNTNLTFCETEHGVYAGNTAGCPHL